MINVDSNNQSQSLKSLYAIRDLIAPLANINFFMDLGVSATNYDDSQLANIIKADNYNKAVQKILEFSNRREERVEKYRQTALEKEAEYQEAINKANKNRPGSGPGSYVNRDDPNAVARHNEEVSNYNNKIDLHRRLVDQAARAEERYQDAVQKYDEDKAKAEEEIREKMEDLKPALDQDMVAFLSKLQQLVYDCFHNKGLIFESFILIFMAKKAYVFLFDRIESNNNRNSATNTFRQLNNELDILTKDYVDGIKQGFKDIVNYVYGCFYENEIIFSSIQERLENLPYSLCSNNDSLANDLASRIVEPNFQYKDVIDPNELSRLVTSIKERREQFENNITEVNLFANHFADTFDNIAEVLADSKAKYQLMCQNKTAKLGETFDQSRFILGIFDEEVQNEYLKQQQNLLETIQLELETLIGTNLPKLIKTILETDLLSVSAEQTISNNPGFAFLEYRNKLQNKQKELISGIESIDRQLEEIARQPQEKADEFNKKMNILLGVSILPIGNLGVLFPIHQAISKFSPALGSGHPIYKKLRDTTSSKLQKFLLVHAAIVALIGGSTFAVSNDQKPILYGATGAYSISAGTLFFKKKKTSQL